MASIIRGFPIITGASDGAPMACPEIPVAVSEPLSGAVRLTSQGNRPSRDDAPSAEAAAA
jgi:hypothetical protein